MAPSEDQEMSALFDTLTFYGLQKEPLTSVYEANHDLQDYITSKWRDPEDAILVTSELRSGIDDCVYLKTSKDGSSPDRLVFDGKRFYNQHNKDPLFKDLGSPLALYRVGCTFPSAVHIEQTDKSSWWSTITHNATGKSFGFDDIKGRVALRYVDHEAYLRQYKRKDCKSGHMRQLSRKIKDGDLLEELTTPFLETVPEGLVEYLSEPETEDLVLLKELEVFVEKNKIFKKDLMELLNYLASDQCVHGYDDLVAGYEA